MTNETETSRLVLTRKIGQRVIIRDDICLTVLGIEGSRVILGVEAPRDDRILRGELQELPLAPIIIEASEQPSERISPR